VAGIIAALKSDYDIRVLGKEVDDLALALISPLSSDDSYVGHLFILDFGFGILDSI